MDKFLEVGGTFDWISPLWGFIEDWLNGPHTHYRIPLDSTGVIEILRSKGIKVWGVFVFTQYTLFTVKDAQSDYTQYWLGVYGVLYQKGK